MYIKCAFKFTMPFSSAMVNCNMRRWVRYGTVPRQTNQIFSPVGLLIGLLLTAKAICSASCCKLVSYKSLWADRCVLTFRGNTQPQFLGYNLICFIVISGNEPAWYSEYMFPFLTGLTFNWNPIRSCHLSLCHNLTLLPLLIISKLKPRLNWSLILWRRNYFFNFSTPCI